MQKGEALYMVAEVGGKVVGVSEIKRRGGYEKHVQVIGIAIRSGFRDLGIGTAMMDVLVEQGRKMSLKALTLTAFASNSVRFAFMRRRVLFRLE